MAAALGRPEDEVARATCENACRIFCDIGKGGRSSDSRRSGNGGGDGG